MAEFSLGDAVFFGTAISPAPSGPVEHTVPLTVELREAPFNMLCNTA
jgi:hypothetical protein